MLTPLTAVWNVTACSSTERETRLDSNPSLYWEMEEEDLVVSKQMGGGGELLGVQSN